MIVFFAVLLLFNHTLGKPFIQETEQREQNFAEKKHSEASGAANGTSAIREKRESHDDDFLRNHCPKYTGKGNSLSSGHGCEKARYMCKEFQEVVCEKETFQMSRRCTGNIVPYGNPKCYPKFEWVSIDTFQGPKWVKRTKCCTCNRDLECPRN